MTPYDEWLYNVGRFQTQKLIGFHSLFSPRPGRKQEFEEYSARKMKETLEELAGYEVSKALIRTYWQPSEATSDWCGFEKEALIFLVKGIPPVPISPKKYTIAPLEPALRLTPKKALEEMSRLNSNQLNALIRFYHQGLRGEHLRQWRGSSKQQRPIFTHIHYLALAALFEKKNYSPEKGVQIISNIRDQIVLKIWLNHALKVKKPKFNVIKQQQFGQLRLRNHYLPESYSRLVLKLKDKEGNDLGIYESEYNKLIAHLEKQKKDPALLSADEWYEAIYASKVTTIKYLTPENLSAYELDVPNSDFKVGKILCKGGCSLYNDGKQNIMVINNDQIYVIPKMKPLAGDISPDQRFRKANEESGKEEKPGFSGIGHTSLSHGRMVQFAGTLVYKKDVGWIFGTRTGHYGTLAYQLRFLLTKLQAKEVRLQDISIKIFVPKDAQNTEDESDAIIVNAQELLDTILSSQAKMNFGSKISSEASSCTIEEDAQALMSGPSIR